jgi:hypothetical protein
MGLIGARFCRVGEKEVTNGWLEPIFPGAAKKRSPIGMIGAHFRRVKEKEVTNGSD